jgi:FkbM family methyltransferase
MGRGKALANLSDISKDNLIGKLLRAPFCLIPRTAALPVVQGLFRGEKWMAGSASHGRWLGSYEYHKQRALQYELDIGDVVSDAGAHVGFYSLLASFFVGETLYVYSFEPFLRNLQKMKRHLEIDHVRNRTVIDAAVTSIDGESTLTPLATEILRVRFLTLDRLVQEEGMQPPSLIKIDIEGSEYECLRGAPSVIRKF